MQCTAWNNIGRKERKCFIWLQQFRQLPFLFSFQWVLLPLQEHSPSNQMWREPSEAPEGLGENWWRLLNYRYTFTNSPFPQTILNKYRSLAKWNSVSVFIQLNCFIKAKLLTWSSISVVMLGIFSPATVTEQTFLEMLESTMGNNQNHPAIYHFL